MAGYATWELAELLGQLTPRQRAAIDRIVRHVYINNQPIAHLFRGDDRICPEAAYYRKGKADPETGKRSGFGWGHDPDFLAALESAKRLALATQERERMGHLQQAKRYAEQAAAPAVQVMVNVMTFGVDDAARINAAQKVIDFAFKGSGEQTHTGAGVEADWWAAVGDDEQG
jgi:hypothetical protein